MDAFLAKHADAIQGVLSCFDRVLFRGYLPLMSGYAMAEFLKLKQVQRRTLKTFLLTQAERVKKHALSMAAEAHRPHQYLSGPTRRARRGSRGDPGPHSRCASSGTDGTKTP